MFAMGQIILRTLEDYARWGSNVKITFNVGGRFSVFEARMIGYYFRERRWSNALELAGVPFRCDRRYGGRGAKDSKVEPAPKDRKDGLPGSWPHPMHPDTPPCPDGIDRQECTRADRTS
jgi:hypothetical protein